MYKNITSESEESWISMLVCQLLKNLALYISRDREANKKRKEKSVTSAFCDQVIYILSSFQARTLRNVFIR